MNIEGFDLELSAEIVRSTSTGLLFLLGAFWIVYGLHRSWRQVLWDEGVAEWTALQDELGGRIAIRGTGWRIRGSRGDLQVRGGLWPVESRLRLPSGRVVRHPGVVAPAWVREQLATP